MRILALAALVCACIPDPRGRCSKDLDCAGGVAGAFCAEGVCQAPPRVSLVEVPRGALARAGTATVRARIEGGAHGVASARATLGSGEAPGVAQTGGIWRFDLPLALAPAGVEGAVPFSVTALDDLGHAGAAQDSLLVDDRAPRISIDASSIPAAAVTRGTIVAVRVTVQDASAVTVASAAGAAVPQADGAYLIEADTSRAAAAAASADIAVTATDSAGNAATARASIPITRLRWIAQGTSSVIGIALTDQFSIATSANGNGLIASRGTGALKLISLGQGPLGDAVTDGANLITSRVDNRVCKVGLDGSLKWCCGPYGTLRTGPALMGDTVILAASGVSASTGGRLYAVYDSAGSCGRVPTGSPQIDFDFSAPSIAINGDVYIGAFDAVVAARFDGVGWSAPGPNPTPAPARYRGAPALRAPLPTGEQPLVLARTASAIDSYVFPPDPIHNAPAAPTTRVIAAQDTALTPVTLAEDGTAVAGTQDHTVVALNPDGSQRWSVSTSGLPSAAPTHGAGGVVYVVEDDGTLAALSIKDGATLWTFAAGAAIRTPPAVGCDRTLYFGTDAGAVFALSLDADQSGLASSTWPRAGHDVRGTGDARRPLRSAAGACLE